MSFNNDICRQLDNTKKQLKLAKARCKYHEEKSNARSKELKILKSKLSLADKELSRCRNIAQQYIELSQHFVTMKAQYVEQQTELEMFRRVYSNDANRRNGEFETIYNLNTELTALRIRLDEAAKLQRATEEKANHQVTQLVSKCDQLGTENAQMRCDLNRKTQEAILAEQKVSALRLQAFNAKRRYRRRLEKAKAKDSKERQDGLERNDMSSTIPSFMDQMDRKSYKSFDECKNATQRKKMQEINQALKEVTAHLLKVHRLEDTHTHCSVSWKVGDRVSSAPLAVRREDIDEAVQEERMADGITGISITSLIPAESLETVALKDDRNMSNETWRYY